MKSLHSHLDHSSSCRWLHCAPMSADETVPKTAHPMKIGIIGTGDIGGALARHWAAAGHQLLISSRHPEQAAGAREGSWART